MLVRPALFAVTTCNSSIQPALAGSDYAFFDQHSNRQPVWAHRGQCDTDVRSEACVEFAQCDGRQLYSTVSTLSNAKAAIDSGHTVYLRQRSGAVACEYAH